MSQAQTERHWGTLVSSATAAVVVGFASTILVVIEGLRAVGASPLQQASAASSICFGMAIATFYLAWRHRMPIIVAWSTPGAVLLATSAPGTQFADAIGAFIVAGLLMVLTAVVKPLSRAIALMPPAIAAAMLAGVLLRYVMGVPAAAVDMPVFVVPLVLAFFALRVVVPMYTVPIVVALGLLFAGLGGAFSAPMPLGYTPLTFDMPQFNLQVMLSLGLPLYLVTMASQNLPGFAVLKANGYAPPVASCLAVTGLGSVLLAPFGTHAINMAAITAALVSGPETHPEPAQRWKMAYAYAPLYILLGVGAGTAVSVLGALPKPLVAAIAGLSLFAPLLGGMTAMMKEAKYIEPALVTFLVTASGLSLFGIGSAFWGLVAGMLLWGAKRLVASV
jgi:benzoate membrane transport protein